MKPTVWKPGYLHPIVSLQESPKQATSPRTNSLTFLRSPGKTLYSFSEPWIDLPALPAFESSFTHLNPEAWSGNPASLNAMNYVFIDDDDDDEDEEDEAGKASQQM